jgi:hypothetical protein
VVFDLLANEVVLAADLLRLPNGVARIAVSTRRDYQDNAASKCKRDTTLYVASADADGNGESGAIERATASEADGGFACAGVQHAYQDTGSVTLGPHVMAVSPSGITSIVYTGTSVQAGPKLVGAVVQLSLAPDKSWADGPKTETVVEAAMQPIGLAYAGETPVLLLLNSGGVLQSQRLDGAWTAPAFLGGQIPEVPSIVGSADGRALVALWTLPPAGSPISPNPVRAFVRQPDGKFDPGVVIDGATIFAGVWADGAGDLGVTLEDDADPGPAYTPVTYYRVYDGAGPKVTVTGPASGAADQSTGPFEATATDIWSAIPNPPSWSFSGGGDASGALVSHSFGAGGRQSATATFLDAAGNASSATTELDVAPAPVPDPSPSPTPVPTPTPTPTGKKDTTKPTVAKLKVAFDRRKRLATLKFTLSEDATVKLTIKTPGVKRPRRSPRSSRRAAARSRPAGCGYTSATRSRSSPRTPPRTHPRSRRCRGGSES